MGEVHREPTGTATRILSISVSRGSPEPEVSVLTATDQHLESPRWLVAAVTSPAPTDIAAIARWLLGGCDEPTAPREGFAVVAMDRFEGSVHAATSARTEVALFYAWSEDRLIISSHLRGVIDQLATRPNLDVGKLADLLCLHDDPSTTAYQGIKRLPIGHELRWVPGGQPRVTRWFNPPHQPSARTRSPAGDAELMRNVVTDAVRASLPTGGDVAAAVSGGLDSTMVAATAARLLNPLGRSVRGVGFEPLPGTVALRPGWEPDDGPYARLLAQATPGMTYTPLINSRGRTPLTALPWVFEHTYAPFLAHSSALWAEEVTLWAQSTGASVLLGGDAGNATFSRDRTGIRHQQIITGQWSPVVRDLRIQRRNGDSWRQIVWLLSGALAPDWVHAMRERLSHAPRSHFFEEIPVRRGAVGERAQANLARIASPGPNRSHKAWVDWVLEDASLYGCVPDVGLWHSDPLSDPRVVRTALTLPLESWMADGLDRSLARRAMRGVVPDEIRLRTTRGEQSADFGRWIVGRQSDYEDAVETVCASQTAAQFLDLPALRSSVTDGWPEPGRSSQIWDLIFGRALSVGLFAAWWDARPSERYRAT